MGPNGARGRGDPAAAGGSGVTIRTGGGADAGDAARLHAGRITQGFLSFLGPGFLTHLYRRITRTPGSFLLVGFIAGSADVGALYRTFLLHDGLAAGLSAAPRLLRSWRQVAETLRHGTSAGDGTGRGTELLAVAVDPSRAGRGVGTDLVAAFLDQVAANGAGADEAYVVVGADNDGAIRLYAGAGFVAEEEFELHVGTRSLVMQWAPSVR